MGFAGLCMIRDALERAGIAVGECSSATVNRHKVILCSIQSVPEWFRFSEARAKWPAGDYTVIIGGPAVLNVSPWLHLFDVAVFGRADQIVASVVGAALAGNRLPHPAVLYADEFDPDGAWRIEQTGPYPHDYKLLDGRIVAERTTGCQLGCSFCAYSWHRKHEGGRQSESGVGGDLFGGAEYTMLDGKATDSAAYRGGFTHFGLDGMSERLRHLANKAITRERFREWLAAICGMDRNPGVVRIYCVVGIPTETEADWQEFADDVMAVDEDAGAGPLWGFRLQLNHFRPFPATPAQTWPVELHDYRRTGIPTLRRCFGTAPAAKQAVFTGRRIWVNVDYGVESLPVVLSQAAALRASVDDAPMMRVLAREWPLSGQRATPWVARLAAYAKEYLVGDLPTRYLSTYAAAAGMAKLNAAKVNRYAPALETAVP